MTDSSAVITGENFRVRATIARHKWSVLSGIITVLHAGIIYTVIKYLHARDSWHPDAIPTQSAALALGYLHAIAIIAAALAAIKGVVAEKPATYALIALIVGLLSCVIYIG